MSHKRITSPYGRWINEYAELLTPDEAVNALLPDLTAPALEAGPSTYTLDAIGSNAQQTSVASGEDAAASGTGIQPSIALTGGPGDDTLTGTADADTLNGAGGNDTLLGLGGNDSLLGGTGNDSLDGGEGQDTLLGGAGNDRYTVDDAGDVVTENAAEGTDTVYASISYTLSSNVEKLYLTGSAAINGTGNSLSNDLWGNAAANILDGGDGNDSLHGAAGSDRLTGGFGNDSLNGGSGNDRLIGGTGADAMEGGVGNDRYTVDDAGDLVIEDANQGTDRVNSSISYTLGNNVEDLYLTGSTVIHGTGNSLHNKLYGNAAANILDGGDGYDTLDGGMGPDTLIGGAGDDDYYVDDAGDVVIENANQGTYDRVIASVSHTLSSNVEWLHLSGAAAINGTGNSLNNALYGNAAANILDGGTGADTMIGGDGDDIYFVDNAGDVVIDNANQGSYDTVYASISYTLGSNVEWLYLDGSAAINGTGNSLNNFISGNSAANILVGGTGNDTLNGSTGADTMIGGDGADTYFVDDASDVVTENANQGTDRVTVSFSYTLGSNLEALYLNGSAAIDGTGNSLDNDIYGNVAANILNGGDGNDYLSGGTGADQFVFNTALGAANADTISDFSVAEGDILALDDAVMTQLAGLGSLVNHLRLSTQAAVGADDYVVYNTSTGDLYYDVSGNGTGTLELIATLNNNPQNLTASQFIVI